MSDEGVQSLLHVPRSVRHGPSPSPDGATENVAAEWTCPEDPWVSFAFAHGAGAGLRHRFMEEVTGALVARGVAVFRYHFPYMEKLSREGTRRWGRPDPGPVLQATVRAAVARILNDAPERPVIAGGKSMGGRMTSLSFVETPLPGVRGIAFFGFPLHPAGKTGRTRGDHLGAVGVPMLFMQGDRDKLADSTLIAEVAGELGARATLHVVRGADHGFEVLKRSGRTTGDVIEELADTFVAWAKKVI